MATRRQPAARPGARLPRDPPGPPGALRDPDARRTGPDNEVAVRQAESLPLRGQLLGRTRLVLGRAGPSRPRVSRPAPGGPRGPGRVEMEEPRRGSGRSPRADDDRGSLAQQLRPQAASEAAGGRSTEDVGHLPWREIEERDHDRQAGRDGQRGGPGGVVDRTRSSAALGCQAAPIEAPRSRIGSRVMAPERRNRVGGRRRRPTTSSRP